MFGTRRRFQTSLARMKSATVIGVRRFRELISRARLQVPLDLLFLAGSGLVILGRIGLLQNVKPWGDDALLQIADVKILADTFPNFQWDPHSFNGYSPAVGFPWTAYSPSALVMALGGDPVSVFDLTFLVYFFLLGFSVYYFVRKVQAHRLAALALPLLLWSTNTYWNITVWGAAYDRAFSLPFTFAALALTYEYGRLLNKGEGSSKKYFLVLSMWFFTFLGDVYVSIVGVGVASLFLLFSSGWRNLRYGAARLAVVFLPVSALTAWYWIPLIRHALAVSPVRNYVSPNSLSQLFLTAAPFTSSLNPVYIPWIVALSIITFVGLKRVAPKDGVSFALGAMILSICILCIYFFIMGWIPLLWPYLPRVMATYDSNNVLSFTFVMLLSCLFVVVSRNFPSRLTSRLAQLFLLSVVVNAYLVIPGIILADSSPLNNSFSHALSENVSLSSDYRVSLQSRLLTRWFPYNDPGGLQSGGRIASLDRSPVYQSWYQTEVYYKGDLGSLSQVYVDDQPVRTVSQYIGSNANFAETRYWLDWYGSNAIGLVPAFYPVKNTIDDYSSRLANFATSVVSTSYGPLAIVKYNTPDPILTATNASTIGFYSEQQDSLEEYNYLLALLSYLGLSSKYAVTIWLSSIDNISPGLLDLIVTDGYTYNTRTKTFTTLSNQGINILVTSPTATTTLPTPQPGGKGQLAQLPSSFSQLSQQGLEGSYSLLVQTPSLFQFRRDNSTSYSTHAQENVTLSPPGWSLSYARNAIAQIQRGANNFTITLNITDPTSSAQVNIDYQLPGAILLSPELDTELQVHADTSTLIGMVYTSKNFTSNYVADNEAVSGGGWANLPVPFSNFTQWKDPYSKFAFANNFSLALNIAPGRLSATIQFRNVSIREPGFNSYSMASSLPLSTDGFLENLPMSIPALSAILSDQMGSLHGTYRFQDGAPAVVPLADFTSNSNSSFGTIMLVGGQPLQSVSVSVLQRPSWAPVPSIWLTNQQMNIPNVPKGFKGLIWKETYTNDWKILAFDKNGHDSTSEYYSAGPGLVYIPMDAQSMVSLKINYVAYTPLDLAVFIGSGSILIPVIMFRNRICRMGAYRRSLGRRQPERLIRTSDTANASSRGWETSGSA